MRVSCGTALVTGGSRGLGLAIVERLCHEGWFVIAVSRSGSEGLEALQSQGQAAFERFDFDQLDGIAEFVHDLKEKYGEIHALVNNAGIGLGGVLATQHDSEIQRLLRINLEAPIRLTKYVSRTMLQRGDGCIVNVSSIVAQTGFHGLAAYGATKAGLIGFTKSLARELGKCGIRVAAIAPGYMATDMTDGMPQDKLDTIRRRASLGRLPLVEEAAAAVAFLVGPDGGSITGSVITIDAGSAA